MTEIARYVIKIIAGTLAKEGVRRLLDWLRSGD